MKSAITTLRTPLKLTLAAAALLWGSILDRAFAYGERKAVLTIKPAAAAAAEPGQPSVPGGSKPKKIVIEAIEPEGGKTVAKEVAWLGLATEESSEALQSQLGLNSGEGLIVTYVSPDSPAAAAGLKKNDVVLQLGDQLLVHPLQLRKLVRMHKPGDNIELTIFRSGKKQTVSATLAKTKLHGGLMPDDSLWLGLNALPHQVSNIRIGDSVREQMKALHEHLAQAGIDKEKISAEINRSLEEARKAIHEALRNTTNLHGNFGPVAKELEALARNGVGVDKDATVVVKSAGNSVKTMVKTDDNGTYVIVADPKKRLTAHDKNGKLVFDGEIESQEQQQKVPAEIWKSVQPMLESNGPTKVESPERDEESSDDGALLDPLQIHSLPGPACT